MSTSSSDQVWFPRDASFWQHPDTSDRRPKRLHLPGPSKVRSLCGLVMICEDMEVINPSTESRCMVCDKMANNLGKLARLGTEWQSLDWDAGNRLVDKALSEWAAELKTKAE